MVTREIISERRLVASHHGVFAAGHAERRRMLRVREKRAMERLEPLSH